MYIIDVAAYNSFVLYSILNPEYLEKDRNRKRRFSLEEIATDLINPLVESRMNSFQLVNFSGIQNSVLESVKRTGFDISKKVSTSPNPSPSKVDMIRRKCKDDTCVQTKNQNKYRNICETCKNNFCLVHCQIETITRCRNCTLKH
jgi:hypothetical protein